LGASPDIPDIHGKKPPYYQAHPLDLDIESPITRSYSRNNNNSSVNNSNNNNKLPRRISPVGGTITGQNQTQHNPGIIQSPITRAQIRIWIHERDIPKLEQIVWDGQGGKLLLETTNNGKVRKFLDNVPHLMGLIRSIHGACVSGDLVKLKNVREECGGIREVLLGRDGYGVSGVMKVKLRTIICDNVLKKVLINFV
jgi:hypothetical protein